MLVASLTNHLDTATVTASSEASGYPASNLLLPELDIPWKSTATGDQWILVDFGSTVMVGAVALLATNFTAARVQLNATDSWGAPTYNQLLTIGKNPGHAGGRYAVWVLPGVSFRWMRIFIPTGTAVTDGASAYRLGHLHAGAIESFRNFRLDYDPTPTISTELVTSVGGAEQENLLGVHRMRITGTHQDFLGVKADGTSTAPLRDDQIAARMDFERRWKIVGKCLIVPHPDNEFWVGLMRIHDKTGRKVTYPVDDVNFEWRGVE